MTLPQQHRMQSKSITKSPGTRVAHSPSFNLLKRIWDVFFSWVNCVTQAYISLCTVHLVIIIILCIMQFLVSTVYLHPLSHYIPYFLTTLLLCIGGLPHCLTISPLCLAISPLCFTISLLCIGEPHGSVNHFGHLKASRTVSQ